MGYDRIESVLLLLPVKAKNMPDMRSSLFGTLALATKLVTVEQIRECLVMQKEYEKQGRKSPRLGELLAAKKYLTADQVRDILSRQSAVVDSAQRAPDPVRQVAQKETHPAPEIVPGQSEDDGNGDVFGQFHIMKRIGADSAGYTYKAKFTPKDMTVILRVISKERMDEDPEYVRRFEQQAAKANTLKHPGIQRVVAAGRKHGRDFYAAEYVEGISLKRVLEARGRLDIPFALNIAIQVAEAMEYAHARGVLHQEIRPSNLLITSEKRVKVVAFGVAHDVMGNLKRLAELSAGMPYYVAPEQAVDDENAICDVRTDIYSLGVVLYHMLAGEPPFKGDSLEEVLLNIAEEDVADPALLNPAIPKKLSDVILAMMNPEPAMRVQSASKLLDELRKIDSLLGQDHMDSETVRDPVTGSMKVVSKKSRGRKPLGSPDGGVRPRGGRGHGEHSGSDDRDKRRRRFGKGKSSNMTLVIVACAVIAIALIVAIAVSQSQATKSTGGSSSSKNQAVNSSAGNTGSVSKMAGVGAKDGSKGPGKQVDERFDETRDPDEPLQRPLGILGGGEQD